jgi:hypothetical protein
VGSFDAPVSFGGVTFEADSALRPAYRLSELSLRWRRRMLRRGPWSLILGAGVMLEEYELSLESDAVETEVEDTTVLPSAHLALHWGSLPRLRCALEADMGVMEGDVAWDLAAFVGWRLSPRWDLGLGFRVLHRDVETNALYNDLNLEMAILALGYSW